MNILTDDIYFIWYTVSAPSDACFMLKSSTDLHTYAYTVLCDGGETINVEYNERGRPGESAPPECTTASWQPNLTVKIAEKKSLSYTLL